MTSKWGSRSTSFRPEKWSRMRHASIALIENAVRRVPEQYFWQHRRFKSRPPGEPPLYKR